MDVINAVQIFMLLWSFTAVCRTDADVCSVSCDDVTGTVGKEVNFACRLSEQCTEGCDTLYKYREKDSDSTICRQELPEGTCEKSNIFTCRYTPDTVMRKTFKFFLQRDTGPKEAEFTVAISESRIDDPRSDKYEDSGYISEAVEKLIIFIIIIIVIIFIIILAIIIICKRYCSGY